MIFLLILLNLFLINVIFPRIYEGYGVAGIVGILVINRPGILGSQRRSVIEFCIGLNVYNMMYTYG